MPQKEKISNLIGRNPEVAALIKEVREEVEGVGGRLRLFKRPTGTYCNMLIQGLFYPKIIGGEETPILSIYNVNKKCEFVSTLVHEYCHFKQWENDWFLTHYFDPSNILSIFDLLDLELDAQKKTISFLKRRHLTKYLKCYGGVKGYIKEVNFTHYQIAWCSKVGRMVEFDKKTFEKFDISNRMPTKLPDDPYWYFFPPEWLQRLFIEEGFDPSAK